MEEIIQSKVPLSFNRVHIVVTLHLLSQPRPLGRYRLSEELAISGTAARTILRRLQKQNLVSTASKGGSYRGHILTEEGQALAFAIKARANINAIPLNLGSHTVGYVDAIVHVPSKWIKLGFDPIEARDAAVSVGAIGCSVIDCTENGLRIGDQFLPESSVKKLPTNDLKPGDIIHVGTAQVFEIARLGAVAASLCSWKNTSNFIGTTPE